MPPQQKIIGGSFAPPLPVARVAEYRTVIERDAPEQLREALLGLCDTVEAFAETPESQEPAAPNPVGIGRVQKLEQTEIERIWDLVPWPYEVDALRGECNARIAETEVDADNYRRHAEYKARGEKMPWHEWTPTLSYASRHLLWYAKELAEDREPCTADKL